MSELRAENAPLIKVSADEISFEGKPLPFPVLIPHILDLLGRPDRIIPGTPPAPPGHGNNERYIYDNLGLYWIRQHDSERITSMALVFRKSKGPIPVPVMPLSPFCGAIQLPGLTITSKTCAAEMWDALRNSTEQAIANLAGSYIGKFHISFLAAMDSGTAASTGQGNLASVSIGLRGRLS